MGFRMIVLQYCIDELAEIFDLYVTPKNRGKKLL